ncbi:MAG TPA: methanol/ethanol family PQQ-dependent dehydrogenase [Polyangiaceae bacterium]|nr:methanol/ethanol family PQQ-dependent dehydrogenase [Polyangiaceae bacterium]
MREVRLPLQRWLDDRRHGRFAPQALLLIAASCQKHVDVKPKPEPGVLSQASAVSARAGAVVDDGHWVMPAKDYENTRFSSLTQLSTQNVAGLRLVWTQSTGVKRGHEAAPLAVGNSLFVVTPFPNHLLAFDLEHPGSPPKWQYTPDTLPGAAGVACCDVVNRGAAYSRGRVYFNTLDAQTVAVDATTGKEVWKVKLGDITRGETMTMAPLVVKDQVLVGNSGGELGVRGWLTALDTETGRINWRAWSTGPDRDVLIGPEFKPFYAMDRGTDLGVSSWPVDRWKIGGGNVWGFISYDPALDLIYYGTANPGPWNAEGRPGDNKWTAGIFARRPSDGHAAWFYQWNPHDVFDHDGVNENVLFDMTVSGQPRKVLAHADRNGYMYILDRRSGEVLSATPYGPISSSTGVDLKTGRLHLVEAKIPRLGKATRGICPAAPGAKDWQPMAFSPKTGLLYIPHQNLCMDEEGLEANYIAGTPYVGAAVRTRPGPGGHLGELTAWDPVLAKPRWTVKERFPVWSGALATAGGLVFYGTMDGWFKALDANSGQLLWKFKTDSGIVSQPISYRGPDGKQYLALLDGVGGWPGAGVVADLDARDQSAANGFVYAMAALKNATKKGGAVYVFGLP